MVSFILSALFACISFRAYTKKKYAIMLFFLVFIASDFSGFGLILGESPIKITDIVILLVFFIWIREFFIDKKFFLIRADSLGKVLLGLFLYISSVFIGTILFNQESIPNAFKVYRMFLIIPLYFVLRKMSVHEYEKYIRLILIISLVQGVFYYLQFIGIKGVLSGYGANSTDPNPRLGNYPFLADFFFLYFLFSKNIKEKKKWMFLFFFGLMPILGQMRGQTIVMVISACLYFIYQWKRKYILYGLLGAVAWALFVNPMFNKRAEGEGVSTKEELSMLINNPLDLANNYVIGQKGTFVFRLAMLGERVFFMIEHPKYALTGVGCVHELSPKNTYTMLIGTDLGEELSETAVTRPAYLGSADIVWVGVLMRYGLIGIFLLLSYYLLIIKLTHKNIRNCSNPIYLVYACSAIPHIFSTFDGNNFESVLSLIVMCGTAAFITTYNKQQKSLIYDSYTH